MFQDRVEAGQRLAAALSRYADCPEGLVLAIPRGGVVVGLQLSLGLRLPLDVLITRKIGAPGNPELAVAALAETGFLHLNQDLLALYPALGGAVYEQRPLVAEEIARRRTLYRGGRELPDLEGRTVLVVDDGVATGSTFLASVEALRAARVARLVAALPVAPPEPVGKIASRVDDCVVLEAPHPFDAVGQHYLDFRQVDDEEVIHCLEKSRLPPASPP